MTSLQEDQSKTDAYWVGALAMSCAHAQHLIVMGQPELALRELTNVLQQLSHTPVMDDGLRRELAQYWKPDKEIE